MNNWEILAVPAVTRNRYHRIVGPAGGTFSQEPAFPPLAVYSVYLCRAGSCVRRTVIRWVRERIVDRELQARNAPGPRQLNDALRHRARLAGRFAGAVAGGLRARTGRDWRRLFRAGEGWSAACLDQPERHADLAGDRLRTRGRSAARLPDLAGDFCRRVHRQCNDGRYAGHRRVDRHRQHAGGRGRRAID